MMPLTTKHMSIKNKLLVPIFIFISVIFLVSQLISYNVTHKQERLNLIERTNILAKGVSFNLQAAILFDDKISAKEILSAFSADPDILQVKLFSKEQQLFANYQIDGQLPSLRIQDQLQMSSDENNALMLDGYIYLLVPVTLEQDIIAYLQVTVSTSSFDAILASVIKNGIIFLILLVITGGLFYLMIQRVIIEPVFSLNEAMQAFVGRRIRKNKLSARSNDEIGDLVNAFKTMLDRLDQREKQVHFTLDKLEQEKSFASEVVETVQHALIVINKNGKIVHYNAATKDVFQCTTAFLDDITIQELIHGSHIDLLSLINDPNFDLDDRLFKIKNMFQQEQLLQISSRGLSKPGQTLLAIQDVTQIEAAQSRQRLAAGVFENSQDGLIVIDHSGVITMANPAVTVLLGFNSDELINQLPEKVFTWQQFTQLMPTIIESTSRYGQWQGEIWEQNKDGTLVPMFAKVSRIMVDEEHNIFDMVFMLSDLSNVKEMERLEHLAHHDSLTGLANRAKFYRELEGVVSTSHYSSAIFSVMYLDLDGFKLVNDTYGHDAGDEVLKQVANRLLSQVRSTDLVARLSGDEFVALVRPTTKEKSCALAERLIQSLSEDIVYKGRVLHVGVSIGVHLVNSNFRDIDTILKLADSAMYQAKSSGKGKFIYTEAD